METQSNVKLFGNLSPSLTRFIVTAFCLFGTLLAPAAAFTIRLVTVNGSGASVEAPAGYGARRNFARLYRSCDSRPDDRSDL